MTCSSSADGVYLSVRCLPLPTRLRLQASCLHNRSKLLAHPYQPRQAHPSPAANNIMSATPNLPRLPNLPTSPNPNPNRRSRRASSRYCLGVSTLRLQLSKRPNRARRAPTTPCLTRASSRRNTDLLCRPVSATTPSCRPSASALSNFLTFQLFDFPTFQLSTFQRPPLHSGASASACIQTPTPCVSVCTLEHFTPKY